MDPRISARLEVIVLAFAVCLAGYTMMEARGSPSSAPGYVTFDSTVVIRQGNGVNYSFAAPTQVDKLEVKSASIRINDEVELGATTTAGFLTNTLSEVSYSRTRWTAACTNISAIVTFTISQVPANWTYDWFLDGIKQAGISSGSIRLVSFSYLWANSSHAFVIQHASPTVTPPHAPDSSTGEGTSPWSWTSLSVLIIASVSVMIIALLLLRRPRGSSRRKS